MALIFQYGSNMSTARLNSADRLAGQARALGMATTVTQFEFDFTVFSKTNNCAAADIRAVSPLGRVIHGVLYEIPDFLIHRETAKARNLKALDAIENEGKNYSRIAIDVVDAEGTRFAAETYVVREPRSGLLTSLTYVGHILTGAKEHALPEEYVAYLRERMVVNNPELELALAEFGESTSQRFGE